MTTTTTLPPGTEPKILLPLDWKPPQYVSGPAVAPVANR